MDAIATGNIVPLYNQEILEEYDDVLHRSKFSFSEKNIRRILTMIRGLGLPENQARQARFLSVDMDDLVFFEVVMEKRDDAYLITGNTKHLPKPNIL